MEKVIIFGYGYEGSKCYDKLKKAGEYELIGFADNNKDKQGKNACGYPVRSMDELKRLGEEGLIYVIIAASHWGEIALEIEKIENENIIIKGIWHDEKIEEYISPMTFEKLDFSKPIKLYAGDICDSVHMEDMYLYGLSLYRQDKKHICFDITKKYPLPDCCIDNYQAEDVLEHIEFDMVVPVINEIYRILKRGGVLRISCPDYFSPIKKEISLKTNDGCILYDPTGGGDYRNGKVIKGGHVWFPNYIVMRKILQQTEFERVDFLYYHMEDESVVSEEIDMSLGLVHRHKPEGDNYSLIIDCYK